ncbi:MAG: hypothetical protein CL607_19610 [Anaerolineaceae bacterium]|nr:hypothetical protein [Anaerolineaceae bacterium]
MTDPKRRQTGHVPPDPLRNRRHIPDLDNLMANAGTSNPAGKTSSPSPETNQSTSQPKRQRVRRRQPRSRWSKFWRRVRKRTSPLRVLVGLLAVIIILAVGTSVLLADAANHVNNSFASLNRVMNIVRTTPGTELTLSDFERLRLSVSDLASSLSLAKGRSQLVSPFASLNSDARVTLDMIDIGYDLAQATDNLLLGLQPTLFFMVSGEEEESVATGISSGERLVELLEVGRGRMIAANEALVMAKTKLDALSLDGVSPGLLLNVEQISQFYNEVSNINALLAQSPELLTAVFGLDGEKSYLVLSQNNDEIRPSGGFIGTYGWFVVRNARITDFDYRPSTTTSPNPPPESFMSTIDAPDWWISYRNPIYVAWDGSWSPDFRVTADMAARYYDAGNNPEAPLDGVIALDVTAFELLLGALGEVRVPSYNVRVNQANFREVIYDIRESEESHKDFLAALYNEIFSSWQNASQDASEAVLGALLEALQGKHLMIAFTDPALNDLVQSLGWSGALVPPVGDYVNVIDANLGNKSNHSVSRSLTYDVLLNGDGSADGRLSIGYNYYESVASLDPAVDARYHGPLDYRSLLQLYLPPGTTMTNQDDLPRLEKVANMTYAQFVTRVAIEYDGSERYQLSYHIPDVTDAIGQYQRYHLLIQKQPGMRPSDVNLQIQLPEGATLVSMQPQADATYSLERTVLDFRLSLDADQVVEVIYAP